MDLISTKLFTTSIGVGFANPRQHGLAFGESPPIRSSPCPSAEPVGRNTVIPKPLYAFEDACNLDHWPPRDNTSLLLHDLCTEILQAHGWDLELAISSFTSPSDPHEDDPSSSRVDGDHDTEFKEDDPSCGAIVNDPRAVRPPGIAWKIITLPVSTVSGFGSGRGGGSESSSSVSLAAGEAMEFITLFDRDDGLWRQGKRCYLWVKLDAFDGYLITLEVKKSERVALCLIQGDQQGSRHLR
ncbi:unnamed protein product [Brassica oleracea var. botrytis]|uniref:(rape) hypothetical protein n=1 Tax=Brassica napus TaxID=3708 RepID=A0A816J2V4_BRANA|nr:unnamed protein product [Brassica napus]